MRKAQIGRFLRVGLFSLIILAMAFTGAGCTWFGPKVVVNGRVIATDAEGKEIPIYRASVTIGKVSTAVTDYDGRFQISGVKAGRQTVTVQKEGFQTLTKAVEVKADGSDIGDLEIVPEEGTETIMIEPKWTLLPIGSEAIAELEAKGVLDDIPEGTVIAEATIDVTLEQDGGKRYTAGARMSLERTASGVEVVDEGALIIMGIQHQAGAGYTFAVTGKVGSDLDRFKQKNIAVSGSGRIEATEFEDGESYYVTISLHGFLEDR